jgi:hypothetical protein
VEIPPLIKGRLGGVSESLKRLGDGKSVSKLDEIKETLNTLRAMLAVISAFLIALGTAVGSLFVANNIDVAFWIAISFMVLFVIVGFLIMIKITKKTKEIGAL